MAFVESVQLDKTLPCLADPGKLIVIGQPSRTIDGILPLVAAVAPGIEVDPAEPGYRHVLFQPQPGGGLTTVRATLDSPYGLVASAWELTETDFHLSISVPPNAHATVRLPAASLAAVTEGGQPLATGNGILSAHVAGDAAIIEVGSGQYAFVTTGLNRAQALANVRHVAGRLDRYSTLRDLLANDAAKTVLSQQLGPAFLQAPELERVMDMSLVQVAGFVPQLLTPEKLDAIEATLNIRPPRPT